MNINKIINAAECPRKAYWAGLNLDTVKGFKFNAAVAVRELLNEFDLSDLKEYDLIKQRLEKIIPADEFKMNKEREINYDVLTKQINRLAYNIKHADFKLIALDEENPDYGEFKFENFEKITTKRDFILKDPDGKKYSVKLKMSSPGYTLKKDTGNWTGDSLELYIMSKCWPDTLPAIVSLRGKGESLTKYNDTDRFDGFLFSCATEFNYDIEDRLRSVLKQEISKNAKPNEEKCQMCHLYSICHYDDIDTKLQPEKPVVRVKREQWSKEQLDVINFYNGECRVIAGAGSGKTSTLTNRMITLAENYCDPAKILAITFTEKGVKELKKKLKKYEQEPEMYNIYTFNGFGFNFLRKHYHECGYTAEPRLIDEAEKTEKIAKLLDENESIEGLNYANPYMQQFKYKGAVLLMKDILNCIKLNKPKTLNEYGNVLENNGFEKTIWDDGDGIYNQSNLKIVKKIVTQYNKWLKENNLCEFQDQIDIMLTTLKKNKNLANEMKTKYKHIIIDEFQDTDADQMYLVSKYLYQKGKDTSLMVCGDDAQAIFSFRNVDATNILLFKDTYPKAVDLQILNNYRSTQEILDICNNVMKANPGIDKELISTRHGKKPTIINSYNEDMLKKIKSLIKQGESLQDIALLFRTRRECVEMHEILDAEKIDNVVVISNKVTDDNQVQAAIALAKFLDEKNIDEKRLMDYAIWKRKTNHEEFDNTFDQSKLINEGSVELLQEFEELKSSEKYDWFLNKIITAFQNKSMALELIIEKLLNMPEKSMAAICHYLMMIGSCNTGLSVEADDREYNAITISTIHAAKGREWKNVLVSVNGFKKIEVKEHKDTKYQHLDMEEIRILFVALSRAKEDLTIYVQDEYWENVLTKKNYIPDISTAPKGAFSKKKK